MQTLTPTAVRLNNLSGSAADLDDSPDSPDGNWCARSVGGATGRPLVTASDITFLGTFQVPQGGSTVDDTFYYYGGGMGVSGSTLYLGGHAQTTSLGRVEIPSAPFTDQVATVISNPTVVPGVTNGPGSERLGGVLVWNNRVIVSKYCYFDGDVSANRSHCAASLSLSGWTSSNGSNTLQALSDIGNNVAFTAGYMGTIPDEWAALLGGPCFCGGGIFAIASRASFGPSFYAFDPDDIGDTAPVIELQAYPYPDGVITDTGVTNDILTLADLAGGTAFPSGTRSVLHLSMHGYGQPYYQNEGGDPDPCLGANVKQRSHPYRKQVTAFDANDLLAVKNGTMNPEDVYPYAWWQLPGSESEECDLMQISGACYDDATRRIYVAEQYATSPRIRVYQVADLS